MNVRRVRESTGGRVTVGCSRGDYGALLGAPGRPPRHLQGATLEGPPERRPLIAYGELLGAPGRHFRTSKPTLHCSGNVTTSTKGGDIGVSPRGRSQRNRSGRACGRCAGSVRPDTEREGEDETRDYQDHPRETRIRGRHEAPAAQKKYIYTSPF